MIPAAIYEKLAADNYLQDECGITGEHIFELQSVDERPFDDGYFIIVNWLESNVSQLFGSTAVGKAPRTMTLWVHHPLDRGRDFRPIDKILNRIDQLLLPIEHEIGSDNVRITCITKQGRSGNLVDDGWKTIARNATYGVLYDESTT